MKTSGNGLGKMARQKRQTDSNEWPLKAALETPLNPKVQRRQRVISEIEQAVCVDRQRDNGDAEDNFANIAQVWTMILRTRGFLPLDSQLNSEDVAAMMVAFKICRYSANPYHRDHLLDAAGYAVCGVGILDSQIGKGMK